MIDIKLFQINGNTVSAIDGHVERLTPSLLAKAFRGEMVEQDPNDEPASVREGITIQQLKQLHRQEISNPPAGWIGAIAGGIVAMFIGNAKIISSQTTIEAAGWIIQVLFVMLGIFFGWVTGFFLKQWKETIYDWRFMPFGKRLMLIIVVLIMLGVLYLINR
jgi:hypothetical protein